MPGTLMRALWPAAPRQQSAGDSARLATGPYQGWLIFAPSLFNSPRQATNIGSLLALPGSGHQPASAQERVEIRIPAHERPKQLAGVAGVPLT